MDQQIDLQIVVKKPPGKYLKDHPSKALESLVGYQFIVVPTTNLKNDYPDLNESFAVDIRQIITSLSKAGKAKIAKYWQRYLVKYPRAKFLTFEVDEVKLIY
jgi:hypothetical protein